jgi:hypothetical protein
MGYFSSPFGEEGVGQRRAHSGFSHILPAVVLSDMESDIYIETYKPGLAESRGSEMEQAGEMVSSARGLRNGPCPHRRLYNCCFKIQPRLGFCFFIRHLAEHAGDMEAAYTC